MQFEMNGGEKPRLFYGWLVVAACFVIYASHAVFYSFGVFFKPLQAEFGWSAGLTSSVPSVFLAVVAFSTLIAGWLIDKYGPRLPLVGCALTIGIGYILCSQIQSIWHLYLFYIIVALGSGVVFTLPFTVVQYWFVKRGGLALGITTAGVGVGTLIIAPVANYLITLYGWRMAYLILGAAVLLFLSLTTLVITTPERKGLKPYGAEVSETLGETTKNKTEGWTIREAMKTRPFLLILAINLVTLMPSYLITIHVVPFAIDLGISETTAASALGLIIGISCAGRIIVPSFSEKVGWKKLLLVCCTMCAIMTFWLMWTKNLWMFYIFVVIYGFFWGGRIPLIPGMLGTFFGTKSLGKIMGISGAVASIGAVAGPLIGGVVFDKTESYYIAFLIGAALWLIAALLTIPFKQPQKP